MAEIMQNDLKIVDEDILDHFHEIFAAVCGSFQRKRKRMLDLAVRDFTNNGFPLSHSIWACRSQADLVSVIISIQNIAVLELIKNLFNLYVQTAQDVNGGFREKWSLQQHPDSNTWIAILFAFVEAKLREATFKQINFTLYKEFALSFKVNYSQDDATSIEDQDQGPKNILTNRAKAHRDRISDYLLNGFP